MGYKVDDCKHDFEKEQGKGPQATNVHCRRQYCRVVNPAKAAPPNWVVNDVKKKGALDPVLVGHVASSSGTIDSDLAPPNFIRLENVGEEQKAIAKDANGNYMAIEVTVVKDNVHTIVQTNNTFAGLENVIENENGATTETKGSLRDEGGCTTVGKEHVQTNNSFASLDVQSVDHPQEKLDGSVATGKDGVVGSLVDISTDFQEDMSNFCTEFKTPSATSTPKAAVEEKSGGGKLQVFAEGVQLEMGELLDDIPPHCTSLGKVTSVGDHTEAAVNIVKAGASKI
ncbi:hypothetical protein LIER_33635 [Lithospermum erythrorhizon]|uniref:Uncharacterized protein n=1 Tax=Lithospermum erythrorhizon TaxID=34254 RepID=A0AAV3S192_LITER